MICFAFIFFALLCFTLQSFVLFFARWFLCNTVVRFLRFLFDEFSRNRSFGLWNFILSLLVYNIWAISFYSIVSNIFHDRFMLRCYELDIDALNFLEPSSLLWKQTPLNRPLRVLFLRQLLYFINFTRWYDILLDAHGKSEHAHDAEHVFIVVEEACLLSEHHLAIISCA